MTRKSLTGLQMAALDVLKEGPLTIDELMAEMGCGRGTVGRVMGAMGFRGYVTCAAGKWALTPEGLERYEDARGEG